MSELAVLPKENRMAVAQPMEFSSEQVRILAETVAKGCDQNELAFFLNVAQMKRLDPFTGQIHVVKRWDSTLNREKMTVQVGVDGYRVIAARTGELAGIDDVLYDSEDQPFPKWAKVTVYRYGRGGEKIPYTATARWNEYVQKKKDGGPTAMWVKMPYLMLGKVAECLALRKAFPDELSGVYSNEEMDQADNHVSGQPEPKPPVQMPKSTAQKAKQQTAPQQVVDQPSAKQTTQQTTAPASGPEKIAGKINKVLTSPNGVLGLIIGDKTAVIPIDLKTPEMVEGANIVLRASQFKKKDGTPFLQAVEILIVSPPQEEVQEGDIVEPVRTAADEGLEQLEGMFDGPNTERREQTQRREMSDEERANRQAVIDKGKQGDKPGTAGFARGQRLHIIINQNAKNTGFGEPELKRFLNMLHLEHARDLPFVKDSKDHSVNTYALCEAMALGEIDWNEYVPD